jgi:hypothetical protein
LEKDGALLADLKRGIRRWCKLSLNDGKLFTNFIDSSQIEG